MNNTRIEGLFPTPVLRGSLDRDFTEQELRYVSNSERKPNIHSTASINGFVLNDTELCSLKEDIYKFIEEYKQIVIDPKREFDLIITQSWLNWTDTNGSVHPHRHPNSYISGVIYLNALEGDNISFYSPKIPALQIEQNNYNEYNSLEWEFGVKTGDILIFPSNVVHTVETRTANGGTRISLAFNIYPKGVLGSEEMRTFLQI